MGTGGRRRGLIAHNGWLNPSNRLARRPSLSIDPPNLCMLTSAVQRFASGIRSPTRPILYGIRYCPQRYPSPTPPPEHRFTRDSTVLRVWSLGPWEMVCATWELWAVGFCRCGGPKTERGGGGGGGRCVTLTCARHPGVTLVSTRRPPATLTQNGRPAMGDPDLRPPSMGDPGLHPPSGHR